MTHWSEDPDEKLIRTILSVALVLALAGLAMVLLAALIDRFGLL